MGAPSGQLVLHPQSLRRLLRWLMPDITLAETAALQAVMDTNKAGHATRMDIYNTCDDIAAVLQMPRAWLVDELRTAIQRCTSAFGSSRRTAVRTFDAMDKDLDSCLRPNELMAYLKTLAGGLSANERRRIALFAYSLTIVRDARRVSQVDMMRALQLVQVRFISGRSWPPAIVDYNPTSPLRLTSRPLSASVPPSRHLTSRTSAVTPARLTYPTSATVPSTPAPWLHPLRGAPHRPPGLCLWIPHQRSCPAQSGQW